MIIDAPAKINLYLKVLSKRDDGYHDIETLFERISLSDRVSVELLDGPTEITCTDPDVPTDPASLMGRAVALFSENVTGKHNFRINVEKKIPVSAGLGGGSSDAAAILKGVNELSGSPLDDAELTRLGARLGADVPFFLSGARFAYGTGRGDNIKKTDLPLDLWHVLVNPPFEVSTKDVYSSFSAFGLTKSGSVDTMVTAFLNKSNNVSVAENLHNDLQHVVLRDFPHLEEVFSALNEVGAEGVLLSGSGPTVFGVFSYEEVRRAGEKLKNVFPAAEGWKVFVVSTC